jgi:protein-L-isoaspartate(D-aspartate) O-methyltransferase
MTSDSYNASAFIGKLRFIAPALFLVCSCAQAQDPDTYAEERARMVRTQLESGVFGRAAIEDAAVLEAMRTVPRHRFVPSNMVRNAYADSPLPIGHEQTISQPYIVAVMTELLDPEAGDSVLEIGTGSGYQAAVLAEIVADVFTIEIVEPLGRQAASVLKELGYENVHTRIGDGYKGWPEHAPFDGIIVTAAPDHVPQPLIDQLKPGGRMVIPVGPEGHIQQLRLIEKDAEGNVSEEFIESVRFVPLTRDDNAESDPESRR